MSWLSGLADICQTDVPLSEHTWYRLGGPARWLLLPRDARELAVVLARCAAHGIRWRVLGRGANVLVRDEGFDGAVIKLVGPAWEEVRFAGTQAHAAAGADFPQLVQQSVERGLHGLENLAGIPGTVGGALRMNAGGRHGEIAQYVRSVQLMMPDGSIELRGAAQMGFGYRASNVGRSVVIEVVFALEPDDSTELLERFRTIWREKHAHQPPLAARSSGCIFKNPPDRAAGRLLDEAGLKGQRRGGAEISTQHANFILAHPGATTQNVLDLIALAKERVRSETGIELELEVEIW